MIDPTTDTVIPISSIVSRLEKHRASLLERIDMLPFWSFKRRWIWSGAAAAYQYEIDALLELGGASVMRRLKDRLPD